MFWILGDELSTNHHLVLRWIRWWRMLPDRPGKPKCVMRVNSHLWRNLSCISEETRVMLGYVMLSGW